MTTDISGGARPAGAWKRWIIPFVLAVAAASAIALAHPDFAPLLKASPVIQLHVAAALSALGLGVVMLSSKKGARFHRVAGWVWSGLLLLVAVSSLFITELTPGRLSYIHISAGIVLALAPLAVIAARLHKVKTHKLTMMWLFYGFVLLSGALALIPGRILGRVFLGH